MKTVRSLRHLVLLTRSHSDAKLTFWMEFCA